MLSLTCKGFMDSKEQHEKCKGEFYLTAQSRNSTECTCDCGHINREELLKAYKRKVSRNESTAH